MKTALALCLFAATALGQGRESMPTADDVSGGGSVRGRRTFRSFKPVVQATFEFAPASGAGMGAACAGTTPTGARGETLTFTRATAATCLKDNTTTGIANGDLVKLTSGQPAVMPGGDGSGALGLLVEEARTNSTIRSEELDNIAWSLSNVAAAVPTVTANFGVAPDGTTTAERIQFPSTLAFEESIIFQAAACPVATDVPSIFIKGVSGSGTLDMIVNLGAGAFSCNTCSYVAGSWTRCIGAAGTVASSGNLVLGNEGTIAACGNGPRAAADVLITATQCEAGTQATSYIPTAAVAVTRDAVKASFTMSGSLGTVACIGAKSQSRTLNSPSGEPRVLTLKSTTTNYLDCYRQISPVRVGLSAVVGGVARTAFGAGPTWVDNVASRVACSFIDSTTVGRSVDGILTRDTVTSYTNNTWENSVLWIGDFYSGNFQANGVVKEVKLDTNPAGCEQ